MDPQYLLLVHSCVASSMLVAMFGYFVRQGQEDEEVEVTMVLGIPLLLFNIAWISAIVAILFPFPWMVLFCHWLTAFAIFITLPLLMRSILLKGFF